MIQEKLQNATVSFFRQRSIGFMTNVEHHQRNNLMRLIKANTSTWFGRQHQFSKLKSIDDYRNAVPLHCYTDVAKFVNRIIAGEQRVLTFQPVTYLQSTSGTTTGYQKIIPSTKEYRKKVWHSILASQGFLREWLQKNDIPYGHGLMLFGTSPVGQTQTGLPYGTVTGGHAAIAQKLWGWVSAVPYEVTKVIDAETRRYLHWRFALTLKHLAYIGTTFPVPLLVFADTLFHSSGRLIRDIADGTLDHQLQLPDEQRRILERGLQPQPKLAAHLDRLAYQEGGLRPQSVWPELGWLYTVKGLIYQSYNVQLKKYYAPKFIWGMPYMAAEGIIGIPIERDSDEHFPCIDASFLEFIPEASWDEDQPSTYLLSELETSKRYEVVVSGWNGLYRYRLEDVIETGIGKHNIPTLRIVSRRSTMLSIVSEKMTEALIVSSIIRCEQKLQITFQDFIVDIDNSVIPPRYRLWGELNSTHATVNEIRTEWDFSMRSINPEYSRLRDCEEIGTPIMTLLPAGAFDKYRRYRESKGAPPEQIKILHSVNEYQDFLNVVI